MFFYLLKKLMFKNRIVGGALFDEELIRRTQEDTKIHLPSFGHRCTFAPNGPLTSLPKNYVGCLFGVHIKGGMGGVAEGFGEVFVGVRMAIGGSVRNYITRLLEPRQQPQHFL
jgi:hypothetical protein